MLSARKAQSETLKLIFEFSWCYEIYNGFGERLVENYGLSIYQTLDSIRSTIKIYKMEMIATKALQKNILLNSNVDKRNSTQLNTDTTLGSLMCACVRSIQ